MRKTFFAVFCCFLPFVVLFTTVPIVIVGNLKTTTNITVSTTTTTTSTDSTTVPPTTAPICGNFDLQYPFTSSNGGDKVFTEIGYLKWDFTLYNSSTGFNVGNLTFTANNFTIFIDQDVIQNFYVVNNYIFYLKFDMQYVLYVLKFDPSNGSIIWTSVFSSNLIGGMIEPKIYGNDIYYSNFVISPSAAAILKIDSTTGTGVFIPLSSIFSFYIIQNIEIVNNNIFVYRYFMQFDLVKYDQSGNEIASNLNIAGAFFSTGSANDNNFIYQVFNCLMYQFDQNTNFILYQIFETQCTGTSLTVNAVSYFNNTLYTVAVNDTKPLLIVYSTSLNSTLNLVPYQTATGIDGISVVYDYINRIVYFGGLSGLTYIINTFCFY